jgi:hypothetical protein
MAVNETMSRSLNFTDLLTDRDITVHAALLQSVPVPVAYQAPQSV